MHFSTYEDFIKIIAMVEIDGFSKILDALSRYFLLLFSDIFLYVIKLKHVMCSIIPCNND